MLVVGCAAAILPRLPVGTSQIVPAGVILCLPRLPRDEGRAGWPVDRRRKGCWQVATLGSLPWIGSRLTTVRPPSLDFRAGPTAGGLPGLLDGAGCSSWLLGGGRMKNGHPSIRNGRPQVSSARRPQDAGLLVAPDQQPGDIFAQAGPGVKPAEKN